MEDTTEVQTKSALEIRKEIQKEIKSQNLPEKKAYKPRASGERMAQKLGITVEGGLPEDLRLFTENESASDFLGKELEAVKELIEIAHNVYRINPTASNAKAVNDLSSVAKEILHDMREFHNPEDLKNQITNTVIIPLIRRFMEALNSELSKERKNLYDLVKAEHRLMIDEILKRAVSEAGLLSEHIYKEELQKLSTLLGCP